MTKTYEKFEEWMVGKTVLRGFDMGVVIRPFASTGSCVWVDWQASGVGLAWVEIDSLEFLNVSSQQDAVDQSIPSEHTPIPWEVGQAVWDVMFGHGVVTSFDKYEQYGVDVDFSKWGVKTFTVGGAFNDGANRTLFFSEPKIIADTMPPKKSFAPKLKFDDRLMVINSHGKVEYYGYVEQELEDSVAMRTGEVYEKAYYNFFKLGEEIKWEN